MGKVTIGKADQVIQQIKATTVERIVYVPVNHEVIREVIVEKLVPAEKIIVEVPVERIVEIIREVPRDVFVDRIVEKEVRITDIGQVLEQKRLVREALKANKKLKVLCAVLAAACIVIGVLR